MGLFDRIKKAFTGEQNEEPEKQEEVVEDKEISDTGDGAETKDVTETPITEDAAAEMTENSDEAIEEVLEETAESLDTPSQEVSMSEPDRLEATETVETFDDLAGTSEETPVDQVNVEEKATESETVETPVESETVSEIIDPEDAVETNETVQEKYDKGLEKTRKSFGDRMNELFARFRRVDEDFLRS